MTCNDCIHNEICQKFGGPFNISDADTSCTNFKSRSRFVELPCKVGEKIFYFDPAGRIYESTVTQMVYGATGFLIDSDVMFNSNLIGNRFFLTREEAEQALKEREENAN